MNPLEPVLINETGLSDEEVKQLRTMGFEVVEQGSEGWHQERLGLPTASKVYDVINWTKGTPQGKPTKQYPEGKPEVLPKPQLSYYTYARELLAERLTGESKRFSSKPMEWGKKYEDDAAMEYERLTGHTVKTLGFIKHPEWDFGASLDRDFEDDPDGMVELKCPNTDQMINYVLADGPPPQYFAQMQAQMWVAKKKWGDFGVFDPYLGKMFIKRVPRDDGYIKVMEYRLAQFLAYVDKQEKFLRSEGYARAE